MFLKKPLHFMYIFPFLRNALTKMKTLLSGCVRLHRFLPPKIWSLFSPLLPKFQLAQLKEPQTMKTLCNPV